jgi:hypothetical protein
MLSFLFSSICCNKGRAISTILTVIIIGVHLVLYDRRLKLLRLKVIVTI